MVSTERARTLSAQRRRSTEPVDALHAFLGQLIVRRELVDNWCLYNPHYDSVAGFPAWARQTLARRAEGPRPHTYTLPQLDDGATQDPLWNAAQRHPGRADGDSLLRQQLALQCLWR